MIKTVKGNIEFLNDGTPVAELSLDDPEVVLALEQAKLTDEDITFTQFLEATKGEDWGCKKGEEDWDCE